MNEIRDASPFRYFAMIPNMIDDLGLSLISYRLYGHLKRVTGESGSCWQSTETLSEACCMSTASISRAKQELISLNLITVQKKPNPKGGKAYDLITILNIWDLNIQKYDQVTHSNLDGEQVTHSNLASYSQKVKNNPSKEKPTNKNNPYVVIPLSLNTPQFIETWNEWVRYRKEEKKKPLTPTNQIKQLAYLENHRTEAIDILNRSMRNGWIGIDFKEKAGYTKAQVAQPLPQYAEEH